MKPQIVCIVGKKKSGKTTFMEKLLPELKQLGLSVGAVKHDAHSFDIDVEGKDSWRLKKGGAETVVISSPDRVAVIKSVDRELSLTEIGQQFFRDKDLLLAEGYFNSEHPKIEVYRRDAHDRPLCDKRNQAEKQLLAMVTDRGTDADIQKYDLDDARGVAAMLAGKYFGWVYNGVWDTHD